MRHVARLAVRRQRRAHRQLIVDLSDDLLCLGQISDVSAARRSRERHGTLTWPARRPQRRFLMSLLAVITDGESQPLPVHPPSLAGPDALTRCLPSPCSSSVDAVAVA
jgi:hypothetical protein